MAGLFATLHLLCAPAAAYADDVRFTSWKSVDGLIQGQGKSGKGIQSANYHATTDGRIAYCFAQGSYNPESDVPYHYVGTTSARASVIIENGWPNTNTIGGVALTDDEARQATQVALWLLGEYGYTVPYNSLYGRFSDDGSVQVGKKATTAAKYLYDWSEGKSTSTRYEVYDESVSDMVYQVMVIAEGKGSIELKKASSSADITKGNACYSLQGATYGVYSNASCTSLATKLTTNESGYAKSSELEAGTYYVREIAAPKGYALDATVRTVNVTGGKTTTLSVSDAPVFARPQFAARKLDAETGASAPQGSASLAGAQITVRYFDGYYENADAALASGEPMRTWVLETDAQGRASLDEGHLASGDALYKAGSVAGIPLGTVLVQETKAPEGYLVNDEVFIVQINAPENTSSTTATYHAPIIEQQVTRGGIKIAKQLPEGDPSELEGIRFKVINRSAAAVSVGGASYAPGETVLTLTLNAQGSAATDEYALPCGIYDVIEVPESVPDHILPYADALGKGSNVVANIVIEGSSENHGAIYPVTVVNHKKRSLEAVKIDEDTNEPVGGTRFALYRWIGEGAPEALAEPYRGATHERFCENPATPVDETLWELVAKSVTDENGSAIFDGLAFGHYLMVEETPAPAYAEWWESSLSSWDRYLFTCDEESGQHQTQVFRNDRIELETTVQKTTIQVTSAAFVSLPGQPVSFCNVGVEEYRYDVSFSSGSTNVRADQYTVIDACEFVQQGAELRRLWTPATHGDTDGMLNLWYRTNLTDADKAYSAATATLTNPANPLADGSNRIPTTGWRLWAAQLPAGERIPLNAADLELREGEHITGLMMEYGSVEAGFIAEEPLTYTVACNRPLESIMANGSTLLIANSASSHITRNWTGGAQGTGLYADAHDEVSTGVLPTFAFADGLVVGARSTLAQTGDAPCPIWPFAFAGSAGLAAATLMLSRERKPR